MTKVGVRGSLRYCN